MIQNNKDDIFKDYLFVNCSCITDILKYVILTEAGKLVQMNSELRCLQSTQLGHLKSFLI